MPNWCENKLIINSKDKIALEDFVKKVEDILELKDENDKIQKIKTVLSFNSLVPIPENQKENWYEWHLQHWGTKWDLAPEEIQREKTNERTYKYYFDTAWGPPDKWLETIGKLYPTINFKLKYEEPGMGFKGIMTSINREFEDIEEEY